MNSNRKGKRGELEFAKMLQGAGFKARRGQQYCGIEGKDVIGPEGFHFEVKRVNRLNINEAMKQACDDAGVGEVPVVASRKDRAEWLVTMRLADWLELVKEADNEFKRVAAKGTS